MSSNKPQENPSKSGDSPTKKQSRQEFTRTHSLKLPTPPPDPSEAEIKKQATVLNKETLDKEKEFLKYLNSIDISPQEKPNLQSTSIFAPAIATEDVFDHLEKLYTVMEQLLNLRHQNSQLQRRIRDLEHSRTLQDMHRQTTRAVLRGEETEITELPELTEDHMLAEAFLDNILSKNKRSSKSKQFKITRNFSIVSEEPIKIEMDDNPRKSIDATKKSSKVSKWTKVKAAFKWEKASPTVSGAKSQDSGIGGMLPVNNEVARYLRVPSASDNPNEQGVSPADSVLSGSWQGTHGLSTPGTISPASSTEELHPSYSGK